MTPMARKALEYVRNAAGNVSSDEFIQDHEPVGHTLWCELRSPVQLIQHDPVLGRDRFIVLTDAGEAALSEQPQPEE